MKAAAAAVGRFGWFAVRVTFWLVTGTALIGAVDGIRFLEWIPGVDLVARVLSEGDRLK